MRVAGFKIVYTERSLLGKNHVRLPAHAFSPFHPKGCGVKNCKLSAVVSFSNGILGAFYTP